MIQTKVIATIAIVLSSFSGFSQKDQSIATIDVTRAKQAYEKEAMYFYEHNWKAFREEALKLKYISGYQLIRTSPDTTGWFNIILITQFQDSVQRKKVEENFRPIMNRLSPNGPRMLNDVKRSEFLKPAGSYVGKTVFADK
ncbi:MAG TPA: hypothetical protein VG737_03250 [Cyclobacteriaceae bacterium]|nr:hypothetical protein [Cyclobacteriaceae bacterium]